MEVSIERKRQVRFGNFEATKDLRISTNEEFKVKVREVLNL
jgi:hypothetical protein